MTATGCSKPTWWCCRPSWHAPRALLAALAHDLPVVATPACGLAPHPRLIEVPVGDVAALRQALAEALMPPPVPFAPAPSTLARQFAA